MWLSMSIRQPLWCACATSRFRRDAGDGGDRGESDRRAGTGLGSRVHIAFEEGTQAQWLHDVLTKHAERVIVCNTRGRGELGNKSDRVDADRLSELLRLGALKPVYHGASGLLTLKELVRSYVALVEDGTRVMLRIKALFRARGPATAAWKSMGTARERAHLLTLHS